MFLKNYIGYIVLTILLLTGAIQHLSAQEPILRPGTRIPNVPGNLPNTTGRPNADGRRQGDTTLSNVERREYADDSLRVEVYTFTSVRPTILDTSISDYTARFPIPATHIYLGNN